jgi:MFS family permease
MPGNAAESRSNLRELLASRLRALRHRNFRLYWTGQLVSLVGTWMQSVAQSWLMHRLTSSAFMLGLLGFTQFLPVLLFSLWAGVVADRLDRRRLLLVTQSCFLVLAVGFAVLVTSGAIRPWMILALSLAFGTINAFDLPARQSFLVELVGKEDLPNAIALNSAAFNAARIVGPALAGVLVAALPGVVAALGLERLFPHGLAGEAGCFWINGISYVAVLASLSRITLAPAAPAPAAGALARLAEGVRYAYRTRPIRNLLVLLACTAGLGFQYLTLLPVYARDILRSGAGTYGMLVSAFGIGALAAALFMTRQVSRAGLRRNLLVGLTSAGIGLAVFAWSRLLPLSLLAGWFAGYGLILYVASTNTMLQLSTEDRFRGRVMSLYTLMFIGVAPIGALLSGTIAQRTSAPVATTVSAAILLGGAVWVLRRLRAIASEARAAEAPLVDRVG